MCKCVFKTSKSTVLSPAVFPVLCTELRLDWCHVWLEIQVFCGVRGQLSVSAAVRHQHSLACLSVSMSPHVTYQAFFFKSKQSLYANATMDTRVDQEFCSVVLLKLNSNGTWDDGAVAIVTGRSNLSSTLVLIES